MNIDNSSSHLHFMFQFKKINQIYRSINMIALSSNMNLNRKCKVLDDENNFSTLNSTLNTVHVPTG